MNNTVTGYIVVRVLHRMTARAMGVPFQGGSPALRAYAEFTARQLHDIPEDRLETVCRRMYGSAYAMGRLIRRLLVIRSDERARRTVYRLYKCIGIELEGKCPGKITVSRCYFSRFYTPEMCRAMSAMDKGIFAGIFGGGELCFESRITEGCGCCSAFFARKRKEEQR